MIGRRAVIGLSLLCALLVCAFAAQSASATVAKNTTAVTCVEGGGEKDFSDAHCDVNVGAGKGKFGHVAIKVAEKTTISITNEKTKNETKESTNTVLKGTVFGIKTEIVCKTVKGSGTLTNVEPASKVHQVEGEVKAEFTNCTAPLGCKVTEPIAVTSKVSGVEELEGKKEMGLEFVPTSGKVFASVTLTGCFVAGTFNTEGTAIATGTPPPGEKWSGSTSVFTNAMTAKTLTLAGKPAEVSSTTTVTRSGGNPISLTTVT